MSARILIHARAGRIRLIASPVLLHELADVLRRPKFRRHLSLEDVTLFVAEVRALAELVPDPPEPVEAITADPDDDFLVVLAELARADAIVSGDSDLIGLRRPGLTVMTPRTVLDGLESS